MRIVPALCTVVLLSLAACGSSSDEAKGSSPAPAAKASSAPAELGTLQASGFGQADEYVWATAVVHNNSDYVGQTVTVSFNVLDADGEILGTESQVESFVRPDADHILGTQVALEPGQNASTVEATLDVEPEGTFSDQPFPEMPVSDLRISGQTPYPEVTFVVSNPLAVPVKDARIQVACTDQSGSIVGGGSDYPDLVPAKGKIKVDAHVITSAKPKDCSVFVGALDWQGPSMTDPETSAPPSSAADLEESAGSAEEAFKVWVQQFGERNWKAQYATLANAQRKVVSEQAYVACRSAESPPKIKWVKTLSVTDAGNTQIPGTKVSLPSTKVTAQVIAQGYKVPVDAHMILEDGMWKWSMTKENIANCKP